MGEVAGSLTCSTLELGEDGLSLAVPLSPLLQEKAADMRGPHLPSLFKELYSLSPPYPKNKLKGTLRQGRSIRGSRGQG